ncbi:hypothetical protein HMPREF3226_02011 [Prevotella corporis]|uniref:Uncharacterized protein n=1 Tax=Prevotella corporis TaxID=28128 RepID=A0A133PYX8_9BACT|nr:hypothetical protein HMPREF3226_02011 [Prevotella corporis]
MTGNPAAKFIYSEFFRITMVIDIQVSLLITRRSGNQLYQISPPKTFVLDSVSCRFSSLGE